MPKASQGAPRRANSHSPKAGGPSPKHRGYKPDAAGAGDKKPRWNSDERAARGHSGERPRGGKAGYGQATHGKPAARGERPNWEPRDKGGRDDRAPRSYGDRPQRDDRAPRSYGDRDARPARDDRAPRSYDDRPRRSYGDRDERPARDDRAPRSFGDRPQRDDRAPRSYGDRDARPARDDRAPRSYDDRPRRSYGDRDERPARDDRAPRSYGDRPQRDDRAPRSYGDRDARPARDDRAPRSYGDRPQRDDRPARSYGDRDDRPRRSYGDRDDRAPRSYGDRPQREDRPRYETGSRSDRPRDSFYPNRDEKPRSTPEDDVVLERLEADAIQASDVEGVTFADLGLGANIVRELTELGAVSPFAIQAATIPDVLAGRDVLGRGRTGSGKTIAFGAPLVERLLKLQADAEPGQRRKPGRAPRAIILAPTRELALQIDRTVQPIARSVGLFTTQLYGGVPYPRQVGALQRGVDIIVGTPGRIEDLVEQGRLDLSQIVVSVLDEADHMCDLGFLEPVQRLLRKTPAGSQRLLFSATLDTGVASLVNEFLPEPAVHEVAGEDQGSSTIDHKVFLMNQRDKRDVLIELAGGPGKKLVFARTRAFAEELADMLEDEGIPAVSLHGDLNQSRRTRNLERLTSGRVNVLVATDVAARGIHVDDISLVIQADAPDEFKTYLHRSGRTGRAGKEGTVVTLVPFNRRRRTEDLLKRAEIEADWTEVIPGDMTIADLAEKANA